MPINDFSVFHSSLTWCNSLPARLENNFVHAGKRARNASPQLALVLSLAAEACVRRHRQEMAGEKCSRGSRTRGRGTLASVRDSSKALVFVTVCRGIAAGASVAQSSDSLHSLVPLSLALGHNSLLVCCLPSSARAPERKHNETYFTLVLLDTSLVTIISPEQETTHLFFLIPQINTIQRSTLGAHLHCVCEDVYIFTLRFSTV